MNYKKTTSIKFNKKQIWQSIAFIAIFSSLEASSTNNYPESETSASSSLEMPSSNATAPCQREQEQEAKEEQKNRGMSISDAQINPEISGINNKSYRRLGRALVTTPQMPQPEAERALPNFPQPRKLF